MNTNVETVEQSEQVLEKIERTAILIFPNYKIRIKVVDETADLLTETMDICIKEKEVLHLALFDGIISVYLDDIQLSLDVFVLGICLTNMVLYTLEKY